MHVLWIASMICNLEKMGNVFFAENNWRKQLMPIEYEQNLIRIWADIKNTARYFGKHPDEIFSDIADME